MPIELTCNVTGVALWRVNGREYSLSVLQNGGLPGHNRTASPVTNILIDTPMNNTEYVCLFVTNDRNVPSAPAFLYIAGKWS